MRIQIKTLVSVIAAAFLIGGAVLLASNNIRADITDPGDTPAATAAATSSPTTKPDVSLKLDKKSAKIVCGDKLTLNATVKGTDLRRWWISSNPLIASVDQKGNVTARKSGSVTITVYCANKSASCSVNVLYKDVTDKKDFWYVPTYYLTDAGVVEGYNNQTLFKPAKECTRAQMVTFIWRLAGQPLPKAAKCKFTDVKITDYYYLACIWGNENRIVEGYKDDTFRPTIVCARKHAVTFLWRAAGQPEPDSYKNKFSDVEKTDYFYKAVLWASQKKILVGFDDGTFRPNANCYRRQIVTFLYKYDKYVNDKG
ncbi:MAG: S-layer homology domain-containing protein [Saccharofermentans sp.]|nr:S-layer homology domain-containing protein [Saccharofermentans sp.]